ncbi:hypothetical protein J1605_000456 [Eschrichtius robustus]|uniref:protein-tyrosine-phosphatase n=1 Tax=Eschrichtius robustus TaxID=9764 RepID=A0AB34HCC3_ESCRO|nr:hypothetical protein J1605_000456 [Eschrichtius robustus]
MRLTFQLVDFEESRLPSIMWVVLIESTEGLNKKASGHFGADGLWTSPAISEEASPHLTEGCTNELSGGADGAGRRLRRWCCPREEEAGLDVGRPVMKPVSGAGDWRNRAAGMGAVPRPVIEPGDSPSLPSSVQTSEFDSSDEEPIEDEQTPIQISWLPLSRVNCSQFLGLCALPGCKFKDVRRNIQKDTAVMEDLGDLVLVLLRY